MEGYVLNFNPKKSARAYGRALRLSTKKAVAVCRAITRKRLVDAEKFLEDVLNKKRTLDGKKYYVKASREVLKLLRSVEKNAYEKGIDVKKMIVFASAHRGFTFRTPKSAQRRGRKVSVTNVQVIARVG